MGRLNVGIRKASDPGIGRAVIYRLKVVSGYWTWQRIERDREETFRSSHFSGDLGETSVSQTEHDFIQTWEGVGVRFQGL